MEQKIATDCLKEKCDAVNMGKSRNCMLRGSKTMMSTSCCVEKESHTRMRTSKREIFLNPVLLIMITSFVHEMYEDMPSMHKILHVGKNSENYTFIMSH